MTRTLVLLVVATSLAAPLAAQVIPCPPGTQPGILCLQGPISDNNVGPLSGVVHCFGVVVPAGATLTIMPGTIIKNAPNAIFQVSGMLNAGGGSIFTSIHDDMNGGDTNGNGGNTVPAPGDWAELRFNATSDFSLLSAAEVLYATTGIRLLAADIFLTNSDISFCSGTGLSLGAPQQPSFSVVANIDVSNCGFAIDDVAVSAIPIFAQMTGMNNTNGDYIRIRGGNVTAMFNTIGPGNSLNGTGVFGVSAVNGISVPATSTLTFQNGTILKMEGVQQNINVAGTLNMTGTTVTSIHDDTVGGDTNKNGGATVPAPADWEGLVFAGAASAPSVIMGGVIRYGGVPGAFGGFPLDLLAGADITVDGLTIELCGLGAMRLNDAAFPTVQNCTIQNNNGIAVFRVPIMALPGFSNNNAAGNTGGDYIEVGGNLGVEHVTASLTLDPSQTLNQNGLFVFGERIVVDAGADLTLDPGCVVKWKPVSVGAPALRLEVPAGALLTTNGSTTSPVVFTSIKDDAVLGDSNLDGSASLPAPGDWAGLDFAAGTHASVLAQTAIRHAGALVLSAPYPAIALTASDITITDCIIEKCLGPGLDLATNSFPTVDNTAFVQNEFPIRGVDIDAVPGFANNTATGNLEGDFVEVEDGVVDGGADGGGATVIQAINLFSPPVLVMRDDIDVTLGSALELPDAVIVKFDGNREVDVDGTLSTGSIGQGPVFTSFKDDAHGGDTNGDGGATSGAPGDWRELDFVASAGGSDLQHLLVRFAGSTGVGIDLNGADIIMDQVTVRECAGTALHLSGSSHPQVSGSSFEQCDRAVDGAPITALPGFANNSASLNLLSDTIRVTDGVVDADLLIDATPLLDGRPLVVADDIDVPVGVTLTLTGAVTIKWEGFRELDVQGTLNVAAGGGVTVLLTSIHDDSNGDTNKNGSASLPAPGDWDQVLFGADSDASLVSGLIVRFAGGGAGGGVRLVNADITFVDSVVEKGQGDGLDLTGTSHPQVRRCSFDDNTGIAVDAVPLDAVPGFQDDTASGNAGGNHMRVSTSALGGPTTIARHNALNDDGVFAVDTNINVGAGQSLRLDRGVVFKWQGVQRSLNVTQGTFHVDGTGIEPVVLTTLTDDSVGGDHNLDGNGTTPQPGDWHRVQVQNGAQPATISHLTVRYGGTFGEALRCDAAGVTLCAVRVDHSGAKGIRVSAHSGDGHNWVAFSCATLGIELANGAFDVIHATVASCGGVGVQKGLGHTGSLINSIAFGNAGGEVTGFAANEVLSSNAGPLVAGTNGNISADPMFVDAAQGNLRLAGGSPSRDAADFGFALAVAADHVDASRITDDDLDGTALPDMGAFERAAYVMTVGGRPRLGTTMSFVVDGPPGVSFFAAGLLDGEIYLDPYGFFLAGAGTALILGTTPTQTPLFQTLPGIPALAGFEFAVQPIAFPNGTTAVGNFANVYKGRLFP